MQYKMLQFFPAIRGIMNCFATQICAKVSILVLISKIYHHQGPVYAKYCLNLSEIKKTVQSQNHRATEVERRIWRLPSPIPVLKQGELQQVAQGPVHSSFECFQVWRLSEDSIFFTPSHKVLIHIELSLLQAEQSELSQFLLVCQMLQSLYHFCGHLLNLLWYIHVPILGSPKLDTVLHTSHQC